MGSRTEGPMAPEISLDKQRPAQYVYSEHVQKMLDDITTTEAQTKTAKEPVAAK